MKNHCLLRDMIFQSLSIFIVCGKEVVAGLRELVAGLLPQRSGFDIKSVHARSVVDTGIGFSPGATALYC
jgi:hypothetical protein